MIPSWKSSVPQLELYRSKLLGVDDGMSPHPAVRLRAYDNILMKNVKVILLGWNPNKDRKKATGYAFEISEGYNKTPELVTLHNMLVDDLRCKMPVRNNLQPWVEQGVLPITRNIQTYYSTRGLYDSQESHTIMHRILRNLDTSYRAFVFFGASASKLSVCIDRGLKIVLPYPTMNNLDKLKEAKMYSTINAHLVKHNRKPIDWRLP